MVMFDLKCDKCGQEVSDRRYMPGQRFKIGGDVGMLALAPSDSGPTGLFITDLHKGTYWSRVIETKDPNSALDSEIAKHLFNRHGITRTQWSAVD